MRFDKNNRILFLCNTKSGSTSIRDIFDNHEFFDCYNRHENFENNTEIMKIINRHGSSVPHTNAFVSSEILKNIYNIQINDIFSFTCIINPWKRIVSAFLYQKRDINGTEWYNTYYDERTQEQFTFKQFLNLIDFDKNFNSVGVPNMLNFCFDEKNEKHLPNIILKVYETTTTKLITIPVQIENTNTLLDIVNLIFENGIETKIAIDSDGIAQGGILINSIQEMVLRLCKILMPPAIPAYTIKDECLGTFALDREREEVIKLLTETLDINNKLIEKISNDYEKYETIIPNVKQYGELLDSKIGQLCGHIDNFMSKILNGNLEEFTTTRIKGLVELINNKNSYLQNAMSKV
jgi:hypothetical protein